MTFEDVLAIVEKLSVPEKGRLINKLVAGLNEEQPTQEKQPVKSLAGLWAEFNIDLSEEEIDELRREMYRNFFSEDPI